MPGPPGGAPGSALASITARPASPCRDPPARPAPGSAAGASERLLHTLEKMKRWKTPGVG